MPKQRPNSEITIVADDLTEIRNLLLDSDVEGNFSGKLISMSLQEVEYNQEPKQVLKVALETIYINKKGASSETRDPSMERAYDNATKEPEKKEKNKK